MVYAERGIESVMDLSSRKVVDVYYNLHKKCLSIRHKGRVIGHTQYITLENVRFIVSEPGRQRVIRTKRKNVHAVVRGTLQSPLYFYPQTGPQRLVTYNPYLYDSFVIRKTLEPIREAMYARIDHKTITAYISPAPLPKSSNRSSMMPMHNQKLRAKKL